MPRPATNSATPVAVTLTLDDEGTQVAYTEVGARKLVTQLRAAASGMEVIKVEFDGVGAVTYLRARLLKLCDDIEAALPWRPEGAKE